MPWFENHILVEDIHSDTMIEVGNETFWIVKTAIITDEIGNKIKRLYLADIRFAKHVMTIDCQLYWTLQIKELKL